MAKEKKDATSLFSAMNKNREKSTKKVNESRIKASIDQNEIIDDISEKASKNEDLGNIKGIKDDNIVTQKVNNSDENIKITGDIAETQEILAKIPENPAGNEAKITENTENSYDQDEIKTESSKPSKQEKELQHIHIALPKDVFDKLEIAKKAYYNNKTTYIRNLILDDFEKNREIYEKLPNIR